MSNNEETGPSDQDADEMDYEGEQEYLDYLTAKQGLQVRLDDGTDAERGLLCRVQREGSRGVQRVP